MIKILFLSDKPIKIILQLTRLKGHPGFDQKKAALRQPWPGPASAGYGLALFSVACDLTFPRLISTPTESP